MSVKQILISSLLIPILAIFQTCKQATPPDMGGSSNPGKANFVWTIDTLEDLQSPQTIMVSVWGSSSKNVYAVGHSALLGLGTMWHFDGNNWTEITLAAFLGGQITTPFDLRTIDGIDSSNIYAVGSKLYQISAPPYFLDSSLIIHFDGIAWKEVSIPRGVGLNTIRTKGSDDVWSGGDYLYHFDGLKWSAWPTPRKNSLTWYVDSFIPNDTGTLATIDEYDRHALNSDSVSHKFIQISRGGQISVYDSFSINEHVKWGAKRMWKSPNGKIYSCGDGGVYILNNNTWSKIFYISSTDIFGTRDEHMFVTGYNVVAGGISTSGLYHFDGSSWTMIGLPQINNAVASAIWCTEKEVFVVAHDNQRSFIFHGY